MHLENNTANQHAAYCVAVCPAMQVLGATCNTSGWMDGKGSPREVMYMVEW